MFVTLGFSVPMGLAPPASPVWHKFVYCLHYLLFGYETHARASCQFLWREIQASTGNGITRWTARRGCQHDMSLSCPPRADNSRVSSSEILYPATILCYCQVTMPT